MKSAPSETRRPYIYVGLAYLAFVVYGSLVPLNFQPLPWDSAWQAFRNIPYLDLGIASRADWFANALLYIPLTFIWLCGVGNFHQGTGRGMVVAVVLLCAIAVCGAVEFAQLFFPPRTVSLNDIIAEILGSILGALLWLAWGRHILRWLGELGQSEHAALGAALSLYLCAYLGFSLFPFDFVINARELNERIATGAISPLLNATVYSSIGRCAVQLLLEAALAAPLGIILGRMKPLSRGSFVGPAFVAGALLGIVIEGAQLFLYSGISQGISVLTRGAGSAAGAIFFQRFLRQGISDTETVLFRFRGLAIACIPCYLAGLAALQQWHLHDWLRWNDAMRRLAQVHFLPFYYHYFTSETAALISLWFTTLAYVPTGALVYWLEGSNKKRHGILMPAVLAGLLSCAVEFIKLFQLQRHPDPTNVLIAASAGAAGYVLLGWGLRLFSTCTAEPIAGAGKALSPRPSSSLPLPSGPASHRFTLRALACAAALVAAVATYPLSKAALVAGLLIYLAALRRRPDAWLFVVPAALPVLNLAQLTGRFFFDEFDILLLATVGFASWRKPLREHSWGWPTHTHLAFALFVLSSATALLKGMTPIALPDLNAFSSYYSPYNALRVSKGLIWTLLLTPLLRQAIEQNAAKAYRLFGCGMTLGVFLAGLAVAWERAAFPGLFNFSSNYRVVGMFSEMHTGGAVIEAYLVIALPFVLWQVIAGPGRIGRLCTAITLALGGYAMFVTYARGGYLTLILGLAVFCACLLPRKDKAVRRAPASGLCLLLLAVAAWSAIQTTYMQKRFSSSEHDFYARIAHWRDALRMMDKDALTIAFGMGLGRYPATYFWRNSEGVHPATYGFRSEAGNTYLALGSGSPLYFEQIIGMRTVTSYRLNFLARADKDDAELSFPVCEKWMLYSSNCMTKTVRIGNTHGQWSEFTVWLGEGAAKRSSQSLRTIKFSLYNPVPGSVVNVDRLSLLNERGEELLRNGDFSEGMDHWSFTTDNHQPWHLENLWLQTYFEQGTAGLLAFALMAITIPFLLSAQRRANTFPVAPFAAAFSGLLALGCVDSVFDFPRISLLFYLLFAWIAWIRKPDRKQSPESGIRHGCTHAEQTERKSAHASIMAGQT